MKRFVEASPLSDPEAAARKLMEIANGVEPVQDGRIHIEKINGPFLFEVKGTPDQYSAGMKRATERGEIGPDLFQAACKMGFEGLVPKRLARPAFQGLT